MKFLVLALVVFSSLVSSADPVVMNKPYITNLVIQSASGDFIKYYKERFGVPYVDQISGYKVDIDVGSLVTSILVTIYVKPSPKVTQKSFYSCEVHNEKLSYICFYNPKTEIEN